MKSFATSICPIKNPLAVNMRHPRAIPAPSQPGKSVFGTATLPTGASEPSPRGEAVIYRPFGTATLPRGVSEASPRGKEGFYQHFGTATMPTGTSVASPRGETVISSTSLRFVTFTEQVNNAHRHLRGRLPCSAKPIGPHRAIEYALHPSGRAFGLLGVLLEGPLGNRHRLPLGLPLDLQPGFPHVAQLGPLAGSLKTVLKLVREAVFGTATPPRGISEPSSRDKAFF